MNYLVRTDTFDRNDLAALVPQVRAFARSLCHDRSEGDDIAQEALASAWAGRNSFAPGTNLKAWVFRIARNRFYSDRRRSWRLTQLDPTLAEETLVAVSNNGAALELDDVRRAMLALNDEQREALILVTVAGLPYDEVAKICDCALGTIKSRVSRARQRLLEILAGPRLEGRSGIPGGAMAFMVAEAGRLRSQATA